MEVSDVRDHLEQTCEFPVDEATLLRRVGDVELTAPTTDPETVGTVLDRTGETSYRSAADAYATIVGALGDDYVGRKYYDDRGGARLLPRQQPRSV